MEGISSLASPKHEERKAKRIKKSPSSDCPVADIALMCFKCNVYVCTSCVTRGIHKDHIIVDLSLMDINIMKILKIVAYAAEFLGCWQGLVSTRESLELFCWSKVKSREELSTKCWEYFMQLWENMETLKDVAKKKAAFQLVEEGNSIMTIASCDTVQATQQILADIQRAGQKNKIIAHVIQKTTGAFVKPTSANSIRSRLSKTIDLTKKKITRPKLTHLCKEIKTNTRIETFQIPGVATRARVIPILQPGLKFNLKLKSLNLSWNKFGDAAMITLAKALGHNFTLTELRVEGNQIKNTGMNALSSILKINNTLQTLYLTSKITHTQPNQTQPPLIKSTLLAPQNHNPGNQIKYEAMDELSDALMLNTSLQHLYISHNPIGDRGLECLCYALRTRHYVRTFHMEDCQIRDAGMAALGEALETNRSLESIYLRDNSIGDFGMALLDSGLVKNSSLRLISLIGEGRDYVWRVTKVAGLELTFPRKNVDNHVGDLGAVAIAGTLTMNHTLEHIDFRDNRVGDQGAAKFGAVLAVNRGLLVLNLCDNRIRDPSLAKICNGLTGNFTLRILNLKSNSFSKTSKNKLRSQCSAKNIELVI